MTDRPGSEYIETRHRRWTVRARHGVSPPGAASHMRSSMPMTGSVTLGVTGGTRCGCSPQSAQRATRNAVPGGYHWGFPSKDEMADYLESYARRFDIRVETGVRVERLSRGRPLADCRNRRFEADNVVVAMSSWQQPGSRSSPASSIRALSSFMSPSTATQSTPGRRCPCGRSGNSGAEVANELARTHDVWLSGPDTGNIPFRPESVAARILMPFIGRIIFHRVLTTSTPIGRKPGPSGCPPVSP